jgi:hypothetical protein
MARGQISGMGLTQKRGGLLKWIVIIAIILAVLWYLNNQGYVNIPWF